MPNLINDSGYNGLGGLAQNYRRVATGGSNYGTRRIQFYQLAVYGLTDAEVAKLEDYRLVNNTEIDIDQEPEREFRQATVAELLIRSIQSVSEVYIVGAHDVDSNGTNDNDLYLIVGVAGDTFSSGWEMDNRDPEGTWDNYNAYLYWNVLPSVLDGPDSPPNSGWDAYPIMIYGDHFSSTGMYAMPAPQLAEVRSARKTASAAAKLARKPG
jgi:hypothetical protein